MDTSESYIKMCEKAGEIQQLKPDGSQGEFVHCDGEAYQEMDDRPLTPYIWLPRQDQLQEMVGGYHTIGGKQDEWTRNMRKEDFPYWQSFESYEQLWLAFVMHEKGKVWSTEKEDWVNSHLP